MKNVLITILLLTATSCNAQINKFDNWESYNYGNIFQFSVPPTMEFVGKEFMIDSMNAKFNNGVLFIPLIKKNNFGFSENSFGFSFEPKDIEQRYKIGSYTRIMINYYKGKKGDFFSSNDIPNLTKSAKIEIDKTLKQQTINAMGGMFELIEWYPVEFGQINGRGFIKLSYTRQQKMSFTHKVENSPITKSESYMFYNDFEGIELIISYRLSEKHLWADDFLQIYKTFEFIN